MCSTFRWCAGCTTWCSVIEDGDSGPARIGRRGAVFLTGIALFQYKGAFFWKMTAGMGDVVIAPLYQALRRRGVEFEFFHRVDALHLDDRRQAIDAITMGRQVAARRRRRPVRTADHRPRSSRLPDRADRADRSKPGDGMDGLESHFGTAR